MKSTILRASFLVLGAMGLSSLANAAIITGLDPNCQCIQIGDKIFDNISVDGLSATDTVNVTGNVVGDTININFGGSFISVLGSTQLTDFQIFYHVTALAGLIVSIDQSFNLTASGGGGAVNIGESVYNNSLHGGNPVAVSNVSFVLGVGDLGDPPEEVVTGDQLHINPALSQVWVTKDINVQAVDTTSRIGATIITQSFHQSAVPEPMTLSLMGIGLLGLGLLKKRIG